MDGGTFVFVSEITFDYLLNLDSTLNLLFYNVLFYFECSIECIIYKTEIW